MTSQPKPPRTTGKIIAAMTLVVVGIIAAGAVKIDGQPLVENATGLVVQIIASAGLVLVAALPLLKRTERQAAAAASDAASAAQDAGVAKEQTTNSHKTNLREELDERHEELVQLFKAQGGRIEHIAETQRTHGDDIRGIKSDQRGIRKDIGRNSDMIVTMGETVTEHTKRLHDLDVTLPRAAILKLIADHTATEPKEASPND